MRRSALRKLAMAAPSLVGADDAANRLIRRSAIRPDAAEARAGNGAET